MPYWLGLDTVVGFCGQQRRSSWHHVFVSPEHAEHCVCTFVPPVYAYRAAQAPLAGAKLAAALPPAWQEFISAHHQHPLPVKLLSPIVLPTHCVHERVCVKGKESQV